jgi:electron transfer flavoprotein alpha subunit
LLEELRPYEPTLVRLLAHPDLQPYRTETHLAALTDLCRRGRPSVLLVAATANGRDLAVPLAARTGSAYVPNVLLMRAVGKDRLDLTRVSHGGRVHVESSWNPAGTRLICTMKPGVGDAPPANAAAAAPPVVVETVDLPASPRVRVRSHLAPDPGAQDLREAERIVAGGRGVGGADGFSVVRELADALHASVAASRVAVDLGWIAHDRQVGQTGKTVTPRLYVAAGISGASHHLLGMRGSEKIVAVNADRRAPIFSVAHFGIVADLHQVLPALARRIRAGESRT